MGIEKLGAAIGKEIIAWTKTLSEFVQKASKDAEGYFDRELVTLDEIVSAISHSL